MKPNYMQTRRLLIEIAEPGQNYQRARFDWTGMISQVTLDGKFTFLGCDDRDAAVRCDGVGLVDEFFPSDQGLYDAVGVGGYFLKMGIGVLQKVSDQPYHQAVDYPVVVPVQRVQTVKDNRCTCVVTQEEFMGYAYQYQKKISGTENKLTIQYQLENTGKNALSFAAYNHNFFRLGQAGQSADCMLHFATAPVADREGAFVVQGQSVDILPFATPAAFSLFCEPQNEKPCWVALSHKNTKQVVRQSVDGAYSKCAVWALEHVTCPELFVSFSVQAGETAQWERTYVFEGDEFASIPFEIKE